MDIDFAQELRRRTDELVGMANDIGGIELCTVMVSSTVHLTRHEADSLLAQLDRNPLERDEGFLIHTRRDEVARGTEDGQEVLAAEAKISDSARAVMQLARQAGAEWVLFDADGPEIDGIDHNNW